MKRRAKTAVFLGAGASVPFGFPVTSGLLPMTMSGLADRGLFEELNTPTNERNDMRELLGYLRGLFPGWNPTFPGDKLPLITEVLSLIDYSLAEAKPMQPGRTQEQSLRARHLLVRAISQILWEAGGEKMKNRPLLRSFRNWVRGTCAHNGGVITTNYDTCVEQGLFGKKKTVHERFDFGFSWLDVYSETRVVRPRPESPSMRWFKLHGSLNWLRCPSCEHIYFNPCGNIGHQQFRRTLDGRNTCYCDKGARLEVHLVAPSMYRTVRDSNLLEVWKNSMQLLLEAKEWIIVGYSLPTEDIAIRSMLVRAYHAEGKQPKITVVQHGEDAKSFYRLLFPNCVYHGDGLEDWLTTRLAGGRPARPKAKRARR